MNGNDFSEILKQFKDLVSRSITRETIGDEITVDGILRESEEKTIIDGDGLKVETSVEIRFASCLHAVKSAEDIGGRCYLCNSLLCKECFSVCLSCGRGVCQSHRIITEKGEVYCSSCKWKYFLKKFMGF